MMQEEPGTNFIINLGPSINVGLMCTRETLGYDHMELNMKNERLRLVTNFFLSLLFITMQIWTFVLSNILYSEFVVRLYEGGMAGWMSIMHAPENL
jgi:hypothetical protein